MKTITILAVLCFFLNSVCLNSQSLNTEVKNLPAVKKNGATTSQVIQVKLENKVASENVNIQLGNQLQKIRVHANEAAYANFDIPLLQKEKIFDLKISSPSTNVSQKITAVPVKHWKINMVQHTHTDIGYTRSQTEILAEELRYIDYALDYCDATDSFPDAAKFRWTCEASMPVSEYLKVRPKAQIERLKKRVLEGRIELTGMYFNFDELPDEQMYAASLYPLKQMKEAGMPCKVAMQDDVNGIGWCFSDFFPSMGIKYFSIGSNGDRALIPFDKPTVFWWESPSGNRMMVFRAEHYHMGNFWGIDKGDFSVFERNLLNYLSNLQDKNYPFDIISIQYSGYHIDNSPPSTLGPEMIRQWNEKYEWPKLRSAVISDFFTEIEKKTDASLPVIKAAWPDWWTDGFGSGAMETSVNRIAQGNIIANQTGLSIARLLGADLPSDVTEDIRDANKALLFYGEHTYGYHASISDPYGLHTMDQRYLKASYAWEAHRRTSPLAETALGFLQTYFQKSDVPSIAVINTHNWTYSGLVKVYIDHQILPINKSFRIVDKEGNEIPAQHAESQADGTYWNIWVNQVPGFGAKQFYIHVSGEKISKEEPTKTLKNNVIENQWYKITLDSQKGSIKSWLDKDLGKELLTQGNSWQLGEFIYELANSRAPMSHYQMPEFKRKGVDSISFESFTEGSIWDSWRFTGYTSAGIGPRNYKFELRVFKTTKRIDLVYRLRKKAVTDPEAVYVAFPFELNNGKIYFDVQGGTIQAGVDQIPGSVTDWNVVQNFASVRNDQSQIIISSNEIPLMQFGAINTGRYKAGALPESNNIYSWPMNNYWTTNFNAYQEGEIEWTYQLTSSNNNSLTYASRFGWENRVPLLARVIPSGNSKTPTLPDQSLLKLYPENLLLINSRPAEKENAMILQIREVEGKESIFNATSPLVSISFSECDALGNELKQQQDIVFKGFANKFIKIKW